MLALQLLSADLLAGGAVPEVAAMAVSFVVVAIGGDLAKARATRWFRAFSASARNCDGGLAASAVNG